MTEGRRTLPRVRMRDADRTERGDGRARAVRPVVVAAARGVGRRARGGAEA